MTVRHSYPPEPVAGNELNARDVPGFGARHGDLIDWYAVNAYAELVGWRCRFLPNLYGYAAVLHPGDFNFDIAASFSYAADPRPRDAIGRLR